MMVTNHSCPLERVLWWPDVSGLSSWERPLESKDCSAVAKEPCSRCHTIASEQLPESE